MTMVSVRTPSSAAAGCITVGERINAVSLTHAMVARVAPSVGFLIATWLKQEDSAELAEQAGLWRRTWIGDLYS